MKRLKADFWSVTLALVSSVFFSGCSKPEPDGPGKTEIKVLIVHSTSDAARFADTPNRVRELFSETQSVFENSKTNVELKIADIVQLPFASEERLLDLVRLVRKKDGYLDTIHEIRDKVEADIVVLISSLENATVNGSVLATEATSFVIVAWEHFEAPIYGLAHEIAHLFGAMHPGTTGPVAEQFPQGFPWGNDSIKTVLDWSAGKTIPYFSGPENSYLGVRLGEVGKSDISSVVRSTASYISNFRGMKTKTDFVPKGTIPTMDFSE